MRKSKVQALIHRATARERLFQAHPALRPPILPTVRADEIVLGRGADAQPLCLCVRARLEHMHVVGTTGGGKTRFIQHCACQDIAAGRGVCIVDPHGNHPGSLYRSMLEWLANRPFFKARTVHLIDPNVGSHVTGFNPLALPSPEYDPSVIAEAIQQALERVWGEEDMNTKPTMQRVLAAILTTLAELKLTLADVGLLLDPDDRHGVRAWAMGFVSEEARNELEWLQGIASDPRGHQDFRQEVTGPRNRLSKLTRNENIKLIVSQDGGGIDFRAALDEGHLILANLSPGPYAGDAAVQMLGRLLTRSIFFHAVRRKQPDRPFFLYLDECQRYLSGDVSQMLAETRKYGVGVVLAHQTLAQLRAAGGDVLDAIKSMTNIKVVTRIKDPAEAGELADMVVRHDLEIPVRVLTKPTVVGHNLVRRQSESENWQEATTASHADTRTDGMVYTQGLAKTVADADSLSIGSTEQDAWGDSEARSGGSSNGGTSGTSTAVNLVPGDIQSLPPSASGNTIAESGGRGALPRFLIGDARREPAVVASVNVAHNRQQSAATSNGWQSTRSRSGSRSTNIQRNKSHTASTTLNESLALSTSNSVMDGLAQMQGHGGSKGWSEALEPILEDRPSAVHSLQNVRYMAGEVLRNFPAGFAAISFVDSGGLRTAMLTTARVADCNLTEEQFHTLRRSFLERSPSAVPIGIAKAALHERQVRLLERASEARTAEPSSPQQFRTKRKRDSKAPVEAHDEPSSPKPPAVKGPDRRRRRP
jgi:hypothetical protein